jgi:hypothetical protein
MTRKEIGLTSIENLQAAEGLRIPGQAVGHVVHIWARLFAWLLDLNRPKFVLGYSTPERDVAFRQGEADVKVRTASVIQEQFPDYLKKRLVDFHAALDFPRGARDPLFDFFARARSIRQKRKRREGTEIDACCTGRRHPVRFASGNPRRSCKDFARCYPQDFPRSGVPQRISPDEW